MTKVRVDCLDSIVNAMWLWLYGGEGHFASPVEREHVRHAAIRLGHELAFWQEVYRRKAI